MELSQGWERGRTKIRTGRVGEFLYTFFKRKRLKGQPERGTKRETNESQEDRLKNNKAERGSQKRGIQGVGLRKVDLGS